MARKRRRHQAREEVPKFVTGLKGFGDQTCLRAAVAVVSDLTPQFARSRTPALLRQAYAATLTWLSSPTEEAAQECRRLADEIRPPHNDSGWKDSAVKLLAWSAADESKRAKLALKSIEDAGSAGRRPLDVLQAIQTELLQWALGDRDPVRERVEALQREAGGE
jgi:hypothetical protein